MTAKSSTSLGTLALNGRDARSYLQGQLTADLDELQPARVLLAACNSPQGRVQAVLWLIERGDDIVLILPDAMIEPTLARLRKYVLRSRVDFQVRPLQVSSAPPPDFPAAPGPEARQQPGGKAAPADGECLHLTQQAATHVRLPGMDSWLRLDAATQDSAAAGAALSIQWRQAYLRAGLPQVHPQTHEAFVAQMLNLDLLGGISFSKGCYTGQEIIARAHYRGAVKRRMSGFRSSGPPPLPGTRVICGDSPAGVVVDAVAVAGGCELLAVISLAQLEQPLHLEGEPAGSLRHMRLPYRIT